MDFRSSEGFRNRTILFGVVRVFLKGCVVDVRDLGFRFEIDPRDGERFSHLFEFYSRRRVNARRRKAFARKLRGQRHGETPRMRRSDQLFRVRRRLALLKSGFE